MRSAGASARAVAASVLAGACPRQRSPAARTPWHTGSTSHPGLLSVISKDGQEETLSWYSVFLIHIFTDLPVLNPKQMVQLSPSPPARMIPGASLQRVYISKDNSSSTPYPDLEASEHLCTSSFFTYTCPCLAPSPTGACFSLLKGKQSCKLLDADLEAKIAMKLKNQK